MSALAGLRVKQSRDFIIVAEKAVSSARNVHFCSSAQGSFCITWKIMTSVVGASLRVGNSAPN